MQRTEILENLLNYQYLYQLVINKAKTLLENSELPMQSAGSCSKEFVLPDEAMEL